MTLCKTCNQPIPIIGETLVIPPGDTKHVVALEAAQKEIVQLFVTERANMWKELQRLEEELKRQNKILLDLMLEAREKK